MQILFLQFSQIAANALWCLLIPVSPLFAAFPTVKKENGAKTKKSGCIDAQFNNDLERKCFILKGNPQLLSSKKNLENTQTSKVTIGGLNKYGGTTSIIPFQRPTAELPTSDTTHLQT